MPLQTSLSFQLPVGFEARQLRLELHDQLPHWEQTAFYGHRHALNLTSLSPEAESLGDHAAPLSLWLARRFDTFVPVHTRTESIECVPSPVPSRFQASLVLAKSGSDWGALEAAEVRRDAILRGLNDGAASFAAAWGLDAPPPIEEVEDLGRLVAVKVPVRAGNTTTTVLVASGVTVKWKAALSGIWAVGKMRGLGLGFVRPALPIAPVPGATPWPETLDAQIEALS